MCFVFHVNHLFVYHQSPLRTKIEWMCYLHPLIKNCFNPWHHHHSSSQNRKFSSVTTSTISLYIIKVLYLQKIECDYSLNPLMRLCFISQHHYHSSFTKIENVLCFPHQSSLHLPPKSCTNKNKVNVLSSSPHKFQLQPPTQEFHNLSIVVHPNLFVHVKCRPKDMLRHHLKFDKVWIGPINQACYF